MEEKTVKELIDAYLSIDDRMYNASVIYGPNTYDRLEEQANVEPHSGSNSGKNLIERGLWEIVGYGPTSRNADAAIFAPIDPNYYITRD